jgi:hypothetical protein
MRFPRRQERLEVFKTVTPDGRAGLIRLTARHNAMVAAFKAAKKM